FVYKAWLEAGGAVEVVREKLLLWVADNGATPKARFVYKAWLEAGGALEAIEQPITHWLRKSWYLEEVSFTAKALSKIYPLPPGVSACIAANSGLHADNADSVFRLSGASRALQDENLSRGLAQLFLQSSLSVILAFLKRKPIPHEEDACSILFSNISFLPARGDFWNDILYIFSLLVAAKSPVVDTLRVRADIMVLLLHDCLELGFLSLQRDRESLIFLLRRLKNITSPDDLASLIDNDYFAGFSSAFDEVY
ncbi:hypothetical protein, partial [Halocynthiibacter styelae]